MTIVGTLSFNRDTFRRNMLEYTRRAFNALPSMAHPRILDIGCGSGVATLELARLCDGDITAVDIDRIALERLRHNAGRDGVSGRVHIVNTPMQKMQFADQSFDIIWAEGSIMFAGFEHGLEQWRRLLSPGGFLVIHDAATDLEQKHELIRSHGYLLLHYFEIAPELWWEKYFGPLKAQLDEFRLSGEIADVDRSEMAQAEQEIDGFNPDDPDYASVFFIMQKHDGESEGAL